MLIWKKLLGFFEKRMLAVIRDDRELNQIRMHGENAICGGKENASPKVTPYLIKSKVISSTVWAPNDNARSKAQCLRRERERAGECIQPRRPAFFPSLTPSRRRRACLVGGMTSTSIEIPTNAPRSFCFLYGFLLFGY